MNVANELNSDRRPNSQCGSSECSTLNSGGINLKHANSTNRQELLELIDQYSFMLDDLCLYLDTHPDCPHGLREYSKYRKLRMEAVETYTDTYGPLCKYNADVCDEWNYINQPWPWEGGCC